MNTISKEPGARQGGAARPRERRPAPGKPAIAVILAGGPPHAGFGRGAPPFRPLMPFLGRPIVARVLDALEASRVSRILVVHDRGCDLSPAVGGGAKTAFIPLPDPVPPLGESVRFALEAAVRICGLEMVRGSRILILPCDQPFTTAEAIDGVLARADGRSFDFAYMAVSRRLLAERYPGRTFRTWAAADLGGRYALQTATLLDGGFLRASADGNGLSFGDWSREEADRLFADISLLREGRGSPWQVPQFLHALVVRRLGRNGGRRLMLATFARSLVGRLRTTDLDRLTAAAFRIRTVCIDSGAPELSADIDRPSDLDFHLGSSR